MTALQILAAAARTPVGLTAEGSAAAIRAGVSRVVEHPYFIDAGGEPLRTGFDAALGIEIGGATRLRALASYTLRELGAKLAGSRFSTPELTVLVALPEPRPGFDDEASDGLLRELARVELPGVGKVTPRCVGRGHAGAFAAIQYADEQLTSGAEELIVVGGVDGYLAPDTLDWLDADLRLARPGRRGGFSPGEGAAMIVLSTARNASRFDLRPLASIRGVAWARETRDETVSPGLLGEALTQVYERVGAALQREEQFDDFFCDINNERARTTDLGFALVRVGRLFRNASSYVTPVGSTGDLGAATVPLNCILAAQAWNRDYASGSTALVSGASWTGLRGAALLEREGQ
jgi:3-oxoacyl-[acyl-carrier-protein] synthase-1